MTSEFERANTQILGISFDSVEDNAAFAKKSGFSFPLLCDVSRRIGLAYGACESLDARTARRISYWIDPKGRIGEAYPKVSPASHPKEILQRISQAAASA